jgi:small-conductance mechanosensitive channel
MNWQESRILWTIGIVFGLWLLRKLVYFALLGSRKISRDKKRRIVVNLNFMTTIIVIVSLFMIWSTQIQSLALSFIAISMAIVLATKELIMCLTGSFYQSMAHPFNIGDNVIIGRQRGQVIDRGLFSTKILEIGPDDKTHQFTGRIITLPNSVMLNHEIRNESYFNQFVLHTFMIPTPYNVDTLKVEKLLIEIAEKYVSKYYSDASDYLEKLQEKSNLETPNIEANVNVKVAHFEEIQFVVRVTVPLAERGYIEQSITKEFMGKHSEWVKSKIS